MVEKLPVNELWDLFIKSKGSLKDNYMLLARDTAASVEIYLTCEGNLPYFRVEIDDEKVYEIDSISRENAEKNYDQIIRIYLEPDEEEYPGSLLGLDDDDIERLDELKCATEDLLNVFLEFDPEEVGIESGEVDQIVWDLGNYLWENFGISIRHPVAIDSSVDGETAVIYYPHGSEPGE